MNENEKPLVRNESATDTFLERTLFVDSREALRNFGFLTLVTFC